MTRLFYNRKCVGTVDGDTYKKTLKGSVHFLRMPPAIAFNKEVLQDAKAVGAIFVEAYDTETDTTYRSTIDHIEQRGFTFDRGHGVQIALPKNLWAIRLERR